MRGAALNLAHGGETVFLLVKEDELGLSTSYAIYVVTCCCHRGSSECGVGSGAKFLEDVGVEPNSGAAFSMHVEGAGDALSETSYRWPSLRLNIGNGNGVLEGVDASLLYMMSDDVLVA